MITFSRVGRNIAAASALVALSLGALVAATPSQAQDSTDGTPIIDATPATPTSGPTDNLIQCPGHSLCVWTDVNYGGGFFHWVFDPATADHFHGVPPDFNDVISSFFNNRLFAAGFDKDFPITNKVRCFGGFFQAPDLTKLHWPNDSSMNNSMNNSISAYELSSHEGFCLFQ